MKRLFLLSALAVLFLSCGGNDKPSTSETNAINYNDVEIPLFSADSAYQYVADQLSFGFRTPDSKGHRDCANYLAQQMRRWCDTVIMQHFSANLWDGTSAKGCNIIASLDIQNPQRILLAAHWDSRLWADHDPNPDNHHKPIMGANDGASGVGALMEMARVMSVKRPNVGIDIIFFDLEDQGIPEWADKYADNTWCLGSQYWANNPHTPYYRARFGVLFDMVGTRGVRYTKEEVSRTYAASITNQLWKVAAAVGQGNVFVNKNTEAILDDHLYVNQILNIPMVDLVQNSEQGSFFPYWHTLNDNLDCIDPNSLKITSDVVLKLIYSL